MAGVAPTLAGSVKQSATHFAVAIDAVHDDSLCHYLIVSSGCTIPELLISEAPPGGAAVTAASLATARSRWLASGSSDYDFSPRCEGWITVTPAPVPLVIVRNGNVVRSREFEDCLSLTSAPTMGAIFDEMARVLSSPKFRAGTVEFEASFDARTGIPTYVWLNAKDLYDAWERCSIRDVWVWHRHA